ncbi:MAG TPA: hypothetical protein ENJ20_03675 [Bacteroidetes bacterium]|nr:hypothetical protein [Bacteroidota bacterium]
MKKIIYLSIALSSLFFACNNGESELSCEEVLSKRLFEFDCSLSPVRVEVFNSPEELARFPGCEDLPAPEKYDCANTKFIEFMTENLRELPQNDMGNGSMIVTITIERDGCISSVFIRDDYSCGCECIREGIRLVKSMPDWVPAIDGGVTVASTKIFFIDF